MLPDEQVLALLRMQRHAYLNSLQLISGWLQLGDLGEADRQAARAIARLETEGDLLQVLPAEFAVALLAWLHRAAREGMSPHLDVAATSYPLSIAVVSRVSEVLAMATETAVQRRAANGLTVTIRVDSGRTRISLRGFGPNWPTAELAAAAQGLGTDGIDLVPLA